VLKNIVRVGAGAALAARAAGLGAQLGQVGMRRAAGHDLADVRKGARVPVVAGVLEVIALHHLVGTRRGHGLAGESSKGACWRAMARARAVAATAATPRRCSSPRLQPAAARTGKQRAQKEPAWTGRATALQPPAGQGALHPLRVTPAATRVGPDRGRRPCHVPGPAPGWPARLEVEHEELIGVGRGGALLDLWPRGRARKAAIMRPLQGPSRPLPAWGAAYTIGPVRVPQLHARLRAFVGPGLDNPPPACPRAG
jgi:hypothetical protein